MSLLIKEMASEEKPRERLKNYGADALSNEELIAIILRCGTKNVSVKDLSGQVLKKLNGLSKMPDLTINKLKEIKGLGEVKAITLLATIELGKRIYLNQKITTDIKLNSVDIVYNMFKNKLFNMTQEVFMVVFLDQKKKLIDYQIVFKGSVSESTVHPREIFKLAYLNSASFIICLHNHPSGNPTPSISDQSLTEILVAVGKTMLIPVLDHIIIGFNSYYSFLEHGYIN